VADGTPAPRSLTGVPTIGDLLKAPQLANTLPRAVLADLYRQVAPLEAHIRAALAGRETALPEPMDSAEDWISLDEAAALVRRPRGWLLRRHPRPVWLKQVGRKTFVVSHRGFMRWLDSRPS
jgi:hypothetical protein